jgi:hypothetical protein
MLHLGNCDVVGSAPVIIFGKNTGGGNRNAQEEIEMEIQMRQIH